MQNDYGIEIKSEPLFVQIPLQDYESEKARLEYLEKQNKILRYNYLKQCAAKLLALSENAKYVMGVCDRNPKKFVFEVHYKLKDLSEAYEKRAQQFRDLNPEIFK